MINCKRLVGANRRNRSAGYNKFISVSMAKSKDGFFGKLSGKIGNVVISSWKGIPYIKSKPAGNPSNTKAQQNQRSKFKLVIAYINDIKPVINAGFKWNTERMTEMNSATSYLMKNALKGEQSELEIDYPSVLVAGWDEDITAPFRKALELYEQRCYHHLAINCRV